MTSVSISVSAHTRFLAAPSSAPAPQPPPVLRHSRVFLVHLHWLGLLFLSSAEPIRGKSATKYIKRSNCTIEY